MIEVGIKELAGIGTILLACIGTLWKIISDYRKKEEARHVETEKELRTLSKSHQETQINLAKIQGQVEGSNRLAEKVLEKIEGLAK